MAGINPIQLQKHLSGVDYPATRDQLVERAQANGADSEALDALRALPDGPFKTPAQVSEALGKGE